MFGLGNINHLKILKVCAAVFIEKEVVCLFFAFVENLYFFKFNLVSQRLTHPPISVHMTLSVERIDI